VIGDSDGVVAIPAAAAKDMLALAEARETKERGIVDELKKGRTTMELYGFE
jgi:4-hydroxy-4-methyl-2-oxoglutarate aldolase